MKREDLKAITGLTDEQIDAIMKIHGTDATAWSTRLKTAEDIAKKFEGVDLDALNKQIADLTAEKAQIIYDGKVSRAIEKADGRSVKAIRALMDEEALKKSENIDADLKAAIEAIQKDNAWAFESSADHEEKDEVKEKDPVTTVSTGAEHGTGGDGKTDPVEAAFLAIQGNEKLKI